MNRNDYYAALRTKREELAQRGDSHLMVPLNGGPGTCEVSSEIGARLLLEGTHRLASEQEILAFRATQEMNRARTPLVSSLDNARAQFAALTASKEGK